MTPIVGKALFSTNLGQVAPRPVANPPDPMIAHSPNSVELDVSQQVDRYIRKLREDFPDQCKEVFTGYYEIHDYFDARDMALLGEKFLESVLERIATQNSQAVTDFASQWSAHSPKGVNKICLGTTVEEVFSEAEIQKHGIMFLTLAVVSIRNALEKTALKQNTRAKESVKPGPKAKEDMKGKHDLSVDQPRFERAQPGKVPAALLRVGLRQPQADTTAQEAATVQELQPALAVPGGPGPVAQPSFRRASRANTSTAIIPALPRQQPAQPYRAEQSPRLPQQSMSPNTPRVPPHIPRGLRDASNSHKNQTTARMSAMAPGFIPQAPSGPHGPLPALRGPSSPAVTQQGLHTQHYLPSAPFMQGLSHGIPHAFDAAAMQMSHDSFPGYPNHHGMQPILPDMPRNQTQFFATPQNTPRISAAQMAAASASTAGYMPNSAYPPPHLVQPSLSNMTNLQHVGPVQKMRQRRASGPRQDFNNRPQPNRSGKSTRGGRRASMRGNHGGANYAASGVGQPGFLGSPQFQPPFPAPNTEPFPPFAPHAEQLNKPFQVPELSEKREEMTSVWVHNIKQMTPDEAAKGLKCHFEMFLNKPVTDVRVGFDKNRRLFAHVNFANHQDATEALSLNDSLFSTAPLIVKVPLRFLTEEERAREAASKFNHPDVALAKHTDHLPHAPPVFNLPYNQMLVGQQSLPGPGPLSGMGITGACHKDGQPFMSERRISVTDQRSRGPSRTYEATADNPYSYSPQDARHGQTVEAPNTASGIPAQMTPEPLPPTTSKTPVQDSEQRPESQASSAASPNKRKKHGQRGRDRSMNRSTSGTTTPEPSTISSTGHTTDSFDVASHSGNEGMVNKRITTIPESREQEKLDDITSLGKQPTDELPSSKPVAENKKKKKPKKAGKGGKTNEEKTSGLGASDKLSDPVQPTDEGEKGDSRAAGQSKSSKKRSGAAESHQLEPRRVDGAQMAADKTVTTGSKPNMAKVPVPDITIHSRKEKPGVASTASSAGRFSYAQAAAAAKKSAWSPSAPVALKSPQSDPSEARDNESRYFTPMDTPTSPSAKSEKTAAPGTPSNFLVQNIETQAVETPDKDDSFVTVQEEPSSAGKERDEQSITPEQLDKQLSETLDEVGNTLTSPTSENERAQESIGPPAVLSITPVEAGQQDSGVESMTSPAPSTKTNWADEAVVPDEEVETPMDTKLEQDEAMEKGDETKAEGSVVSEASTKTAPRDTCSIHPNARQKKKSLKKGKSYGKGKKGASGKCLLLLRFTKQLIYQSLQVTGTSTTPYSPCWIESPTPLLWLKFSCCNGVITVEPDLTCTI